MDILQLYVHLQPALVSYKYQTIRVSMDKAQRGLQVHTVCTVLYCCVL